MTTDQLLSLLRTALQNIRTVEQSTLLDRSQRTMLQIASGRVTTVGKQLKAGQGKSAAQPAQTKSAA